MQAGCGGINDGHELLTAMACGDKLVILVSCGVQAAVTLEWLEQQSEVVLTAPVRP